jgi:hypothetical protein
VVNPESIILHHWWDNSESQETHFEFPPHHLVMCDFGSLICRLGDYQVSLLLVVCCTDPRELFAYTIVWTAPHGVSSGVIITLVSQKLWGFECFQQKWCLYYY